MNYIPSAYWYSLSAKDGFGFHIDAYKMALSLIRTEDKIVRLLEMIVPSAN